MEEHTLNHAGRYPHLSLRKAPKSCRGVAITKFTQRTFHSFLLDLCVFVSKNVFSRAAGVSLHVFDCLTFHVGSVAQRLYRVVVLGYVGHSLNSLKGGYIGDYIGGLL